MSEAGKQVSLPDAPKHSGISSDTHLAAHHSPLLLGVLPVVARGRTLAILVRIPGE